MREKRPREMELPPWRRESRAGRAPSLPGARSWEARALLLLRGAATSGLGSGRRGGAHQHHRPRGQRGVPGGRLAAGRGPQARPGCPHPSLDMGVEPEEETRVVIPSRASRKGRRSLPVARLVTRVRLQDRRQLCGRHGTRPQRCARQGGQRPIDRDRFSAISPQQACASLGCRG